MTLDQIIQKYSSFVPVPIVQIANDLGIEVYETSDLLDNQSGLIQKEKDKFVIYINEKHSSVRKRFTIAHEVAHFLLHKDKIDIKEHFTNIKQPLALARESGNSLSVEERTIELEANKVAGEILMPEENFKKIWEQSNDVEDVARKFNVSVSAATVRANILLHETII